MKSKLLFFALLFSVGLIAQKLPREVQKGQLVAESISLEDVLITNKTANTATISKNDGTFQIHVRVNDTLIFSGFNFPRQLLILNEADLKFNVLKIKIESRATNLEEVIINPNALSGDLKKDNENIKVTRLTANVDNLAVMDQLYFDDVKSSPDNKLMPGYLDPTYMMDFAKIGKKLVRSFKRSEAQKNKNKDITRFSVLVQSRFSDDFFRNTLKIEQFEITNFLIFCEKDPKSIGLVANSNDFELVQYLKQKKLEFRALKKE